MVMFTDTHILLSSCSPNTVRTPSVLEGMIQYVQCPTDVNHWLSAAPPWNVLRLCNHLDWYMYIYYILYYIFISIISYMVFFLSDVSLYFFSRRFKSGPVPASCMGNLHQRHVAGAEPCNVGGMPGMPHLMLGENWVMDVKLLWFKNVQNRK